jgi:PAS domain-containing protein
VELSRKKNVVDAYFARVGRDGLDELREVRKLLYAVPLFKEVIDAMPVAVAVLNEKGQAILTNRFWQQTQGLADCALGKRHGELLECLHAAEGADGCGTSRECGRCGAAISIVTARQTPGQVTREYRLQRDVLGGTETVELQVTTTAVRIEDREFFIFAVQDLAPQKIIEDHFA